MHPKPNVQHKKRPFLQICQIGCLNIFLKQKGTDTGVHWPYEGRNMNFNKRDQRDYADTTNTSEPEPVVSRLPPQVPIDKKSKNKQREMLDEYNQIKQQLEAIRTAEEKIKQEQLLEQLEQTNRQQQLPPTPAAASKTANSKYHDQSKVPAAMRTSLMFGVSGSFFQSKFSLKIISTII
jgi:hypothetical protein